MPELEKISRKGIGLKVQPVSHPSVGKEVAESHTLEGRLTKLDILDSANTARVDGQRGLSSLEPALGWDLLGSRTVRIAIGPDFTFLILVATTF